MKKVSELTALDIEKIAFVYFLITKLMYWAGTFEQWEDDYQALRIVGVRYDGRQTEGVITGKTLERDRWLK